jgi:tetratricopeptide (TPR) repeat protein
MKKILIILTLIFHGMAFNGIQSQENSFLKAKAAFEKSEFKLASNLLGIHLEMYPKHQEARILRAKSNINISNFQEVLDDLTQLKVSGNFDILLLQARAYAGLGNTKQAVEKLNNYLNTGNKISDKIIKSFPEFNLMKNSAEWNDLWKKAAYSEKEKIFIDASYALTSGRLDEAADRFDTYLEKYKTNAEAYYLRAKLYYDKMEYKNALNYFESAINLNPSAEYKLGKANTLLKLKKEKNALELYNSIIKEDSLAINAYLGRSQVQMLLRKNNEALQDISIFRKYYPENHEALFTESTIKNNSGDFLGAIGGFGILIKSDPSKPEYFIGRADAYTATKTYQYAIKDYSMALDLEPKNIDVYKKKARASRLSGDMKAACTDWGHAARLGDVESMGLLQRYCKGK